MNSANTIIRFTTNSEKSADGSNFNLTAKVEDDPNCQWVCHLKVESSQSKTELSIEVRPATTAKASASGRYPMFFYDIYRSDFLRSARNEAPEKARLDLMVISRTAFPSASFHTLGRTIIAKDGIAPWLTTMITASLQKILKNGFDEPVKQARPEKLTAKKVKHTEAAPLT